MPPARPSSARRKKECGARLAFGAHRSLRSVTAPRSIELQTASSLYCVSCHSNDYALPSQCCAHRQTGACALEPPRRVELPPDGLRDRYTAVVLRGQNRAGDRSRTDLSLCGAQSCHLDSPAWRCRVWQHLVSRITVGATAAFGDSSRASGRIRTDVLSGQEPGAIPFCYRSISSRDHPARAGRSSGNVVVPPSGIEPEPLGLQPSAQTNYARVGYERRPCLEHGRRRSSSSFFDCQRAGRAGRTSGTGALASYASAPLSIRDLD